MERDFSFDWENPNNPDGPNYRPPPVTPGLPPPIDHGPNWNNGVAPAIPDERYNYNGGSPVNSPNEPLKPGNGWEWQGPQSPVWDADTRQWNYGSWNQAVGRGIGFSPATNPAPQGGGTPPPSSGGGAVPPMGARIPSATLPGDIQAQFNAQPQKTPIQGAYQDALLSVLGRSQQTPSLSDPTLAPQAEVFRVQQQRSQERNRKQQAERAAAQGYSDSGFLENRIEKGIQEQNFNTANFNANLIGRELDARRQELLAALQLASATGDGEAQRELQTRLAQVSAMMQQQGLNLQGQLGFGDLALRAALGEMGNNQFYDSLGINTALGMEGLNQRALEIIMRGGR